MMTKKISSALLCALFLLGGCATTMPESPTKPMTLRLIGHATLPHKMAFAGTVVGGLSGIDYDAKTDTFYLLSDDRSDHGPARFYTASIAYSDKDMGAVTVQSVVTLKQPDGSTFPDKVKGGNVPDPEAIRFRPSTQTLLWTSEGDKRLGLSPFIREMGLQGQFMRELPLPEYMKTTADATQRGPRNNESFEGLSLSVDQRYAWASLESPLFEDGEQAKVGQASGPTRITQFDLTTGKVEQQFAYSADPISVAPTPATGWADNGIVEILMAYPNRMLVLERAFVQGVGNSIRLYEVDVRSGSETSSFPALRNTGVRPVQKRLVADFAKFNLPKLDNTEGMTFGRRLPNGKRSLVFVSDDNFNPRQITQIVVMEVDE